MIVVRCSLFVEQVGCDTCVGYSGERKVIKMRESSKWPFLKWTCSSTSDGLMVGVYRSSYRLVATLQRKSEAGCL